MKRFGIASFLFLIWIAVGEGIAQHQPVIDPDPGGTGYSSAVGARPLPANNRGVSQANPSLIFVKGPFNFLDQIGSKSYEYIVPVVHLTGRGAWI